MKSQYIINKHLFKLSLDNMIDDNNCKYITQFRDVFKNAKDKNHYRYRLLKQNRKNQVKLKSISLVFAENDYSTLYINIYNTSHKKKKKSRIKIKINDIDNFVSIKMGQKERIIENSNLVSDIKYLYNVYSTPNVDKNKLYECVNHIYTACNPPVLSIDTILRVVVPTVFIKQYILLFRVIKDNQHMEPLENLWSYHQRPFSQCINKERRIFYDFSDYIVFKDKRFLTTKLHKLLNSFNRKFGTYDIGHAHEFKYVSRRYGSYKLSTTINKLNNKSYIRITYRGIPIKLGQNYIEKFNQYLRKDHPIKYKIQDYCEKKEILFYNN